MAGDTATWEQRRAQTPVTRSYAYLNCGWVGPMSQAVADAMRARIDLELTHGATTRVATEDRAALVERLRSGTARMLGADPDEVALTGNTTEGVNIAVNGLALQPGDGVVTTSVEHGSGLVPAYYQRLRRGAEVRVVALSSQDGPGAMVEAFDRAIDAGTRLVILSEISYSTGQVLPVRAIVELAHARGASVVIDGAQTAGHIPLDVHALGVDAYAVPSHKWLCGPGGVGMLYVRRERIPDFDPVKVSGRAAASYDYVGGFEPDREHITKFEVSTMSTPAVAGAAVAVEQYLAAGPQAVWDRVRALNRHAEARFGAVEDVEVFSPTRDDTRSGLFLFRVAHQDPAAVAAWLQAAGKVVCRSVRQYEAVRLSLHVYNTEEEVDRAATLVGRLTAGEVPPEEVAAASPAAEA